jgi:hypothetical protein
MIAERCGNKKLNVGKIGADGFIYLPTGYAYLRKNGGLISGYFYVEYRGVSYGITYHYVGGWKVIKYVKNNVGYFEIKSGEQTYHTWEIELLFALCKRMTDPLERPFAEKILEGLSDPLGRPLAEKLREGLQYCEFRDWIKK